MTQRLPRKLLMRMRVPPSELGEELADLPGRELVERRNRVNQVFGVRQVKELLLTAADAR